MPSNKPLVAVVSDRRQIDAAHYFHMVGEKYLQALISGSGIYPIGLPSMANKLDVSETLDHVDGLFFTGSPSNVEPARYAGPPSKPGTWHDPERDSVALSILPAAVKAGLPLLGVCRGFQEINVAFGGTLHQLVHEVPGYNVHKEDPNATFEVQYGPSHEVTFVAGGLLERITGEQTITVNSLHSQAVDQLADGLKVEATADDGLVEAFVIEDAPAFALGVQWHPEWRVQEDEPSMAIFKAFGDACRKHHAVGS